MKKNLDFSKFLVTSFDYLFSLRCFDLKFVTKLTKTPRINEQATVVIVIVMSAPKEIVKEKPPIPVINIVATTNKFLLSLKSTV